MARHDEAITGKMI